MDAALIIVLGGLPLAGIVGLLYGWYRDHKEARKKLELEGPETSRFGGYTSENYTVKDVSYESPRPISPPSPVRPPLTFPNRPIYPPGMTAPSQSSSGDGFLAGVVTAAIVGEMLSNHSSAQSSSADTSNDVAPVYAPPSDPTPSVDTPSAPEVSDQPTYSDHNDYSSSSDNSSSSSDSFSSGD